MGYGILIDGLKPEIRRANADAQERFPPYLIAFRMLAHLFDHSGIA